MPRIVVHDKPSSKIKKNGKSNASWNRKYSFTNPNGYAFKREIAYNVELYQGGKISRDSLSHKIAHSTAFFVSKEIDRALGILYKKLDRVYRIPK